jgi:hypothetical protein
MYEFDCLISSAREKAKQSGMKKSDIDDAITSVREKKRKLPRLPSHSE